MSTARFVPTGAIVALASTLPALGAETDAASFSALHAPEAADPLLDLWTKPAPPEKAFVISSTTSLSLACMPVLVREIAPDAPAAMPVAQVDPDAFAIGRMPVLVPPACEPAPPPQAK